MKKELIQIAAAILFIPLSACTKSQPAPEPMPQSPKATVAGEAAVSEAHPTKLANGVMREFDENHDGKLSELEYTHATLAVFQSLDKNGDSKLSPAECKGLMPGDEMKAADLDGDGFISLSETMKDRENAFHEKDLNGDGYLTMDEITHSVSKKQEYARAKHSGKMAKQ